MYDSIQIGYGNVSSKTLTQPELVIYKIKYSTFKIFKEFRVDENNEFKIGQVLNVDSFSPGQLVNIRGKSIGKGFWPSETLEFYEVQ
jgi:large subunit ribosomal protein L3